MEMDLFVAESINGGLKGLTDLLYTLASGVDGSETSLDALKVLADLSHDMSVKFNEAFAKRNGGDVA